MFWLLTTAIGCTLRDAPAPEGTAAHAALQAQVEAGEQARIVTEEGERIQALLAELETAEDREALLAEIEASLARARAAADAAALSMDEAEEALSP